MLLDERQNRTKLQQRKNRFATSAVDQSSFPRHSMKRVANKVKNVCRIKQVVSKKRKKPIASIFTVSSNRIDQAESKSKHFKKVVIQQRLANSLKQCQNNACDLQELREMAQKMPHVEKMRNCCPLPCFQSTHELDIHKAVRSRHLELENLCCFDSCVIRGGCVCVVVAEALHVLITTVVVFFKLHLLKFEWWSELKNFNINAIIFHQCVIYALLLFNLITIVMICALIRSILRFERIYAKLHLRYHFFALAFNLTMLTLFVSALSLTDAEKWNLLNSILVACFFFQTLIQLWAIPIIRDCFNFFNLLYILISIAE